MVNMSMNMNMTVSYLHLSYITPSLTPPLASERQFVSERDSERDSKIVSERDKVKTPDSPLEPYPTPPWEGCPYSNSNSSNSNSNRDPFLG